MNYDFITLYKLGVGPVLVRHSEIIEIESTADCYTRISLSSGAYLIVEQGPLTILQLIEDVERLKDLLDKKE